MVRITLEYTSPPTFIRGMTISTLLKHYDVSMVVIALEGCMKKDSGIMVFKQQTAGMH